MIAIQAPLKNGNSGAAVANLQAALLAFVQKGVIKALAAPNHPTADELKALAETMRTAETPRSTFGDATTALVRWLQVQQGKDNLAGAVDDWTAKLITDQLHTLGLLDAPPVPFVVTGTVTHPPAGSAAGAPVAGVKVRVYTQDVAAATLVGEAVTGLACHCRYTRRRPTERNRSSKPLRRSNVRYSR